MKVEMKWHVEECRLLSIKKYAPIVYLTASYLSLKGQDAPYDGSNAANPANQPKAKDFNDYQQHTNSEDQYSDTVNMLPRPGTWCTEPN